MKVLAIPTLASGLTAALSVLFFTGLSRVLGDSLLGQIILVQAASAVVAMTCIPQCWVYLIAAQRPEELVARYRHGFTAELTGMSLGAVVIATLTLLSTADKWHGALLVYASLAVQASSSCLGWLRANESWGRYTLWVLGPNLIRVPLIWATPSLVAHGWLPDARGDQALAMALYFLAPDLVRWLVIAVPIAIKHYRWPPLRETARATVIILQNWLFDVGSALTEVTDKVVVGTLLGPQALVAYFFARRLGIVATMVCEPFYAEQFRRAVATTDRGMRAQRQTLAYKQGLGLAFGLFIAMTVAIALALRIPLLADFVPAAVLALLPLFGLVLLLDCLLAANRWSRYIAQLNGGNARLLAVRIVLFGLFAFNVWLFGSLLSGLGLALAFALTWLLEAGYISQRLRSIRRQLSLGANAV